VPGAGVPAVPGAGVPAVPGAGVPAVLRGGDSASGSQGAVKRWFAENIEETKI
jgi:hypothetical protein